MVTGAAHATGVASAWGTSQENHATFAFLATLANTAMRSVMRKQPVEGMGTVHPTASAIASQDLPGWIARSVRMTCLETGVRMHATGRPPAQETGGALLMAHANAWRAGAVQNVTNARLTTLEICASGSAAEQRPALATDDALATGHVSVTRNLVVNFVTFVLPGMWGISAKVLATPARTAPPRAAACLMGHASALKGFPGWNAMNAHLDCMETSVFINAAGRTLAVEVGGVFQTALASVILVSLANSAICARKVFTGRAVH